jgi:hypothetical protein
MPKVWCGQKSWDCKSQRQSDVFDPKTNGNLSTSNLKDVMRHTEKPLGSSRRSLGSSDSFKNPVTHEVVLVDRVCDIKIISRFCASNKGKDRGKDGPTFVYKLSPEISDHRGQHLVPNYKPSRSASIETHGGSIIFDGGCSSDISSKTRRSIETDYYCSSNLICQICGEKLKKLDAIEAHDLSNHAGEHQYPKFHLIYILSCCCLSPNICSLVIQNQIMVDSIDQKSISVIYCLYVHNCTHCLTLNVHTPPLMEREAKKERDHLHFK